MIDRLRLAQAAVPRYTSYPTAPHFGPAVNSKTVESWLSALTPNAKLSAYFHVPFCESMCFYCGCHTKVVRKREPINTYTEYLLKEIELVSEASGSHQLTEIHWGGGTPSMLGAENLRRVWEKLRTWFDLRRLAEHAMELDPRGLTPEFARLLAEIGVNRASLGVQDFNADVQKAIGRVQPLEVVQAAFAALRGAGISRINVDLIYGLPLQTIEHIQENVRQTVALSPDRVSVFGYAHVPWMKKHQRLIDEAALPDSGQRLDQADAVHAALVKAGYLAIGMDHYAKPYDTLSSAAEAQELHRNFQGYTTDSADALVGFGASAISTYAQGYAQNDPGLSTYQKRIEAGQLPIIRGHAFSADDKRRGALIEQLMCNFEVDVADGLAEFDASFNRLRQLQDEGLVVVDGSRVQMTQEGRPFVRLAAQAFDAYAGSGGRFSKAV